MNPRKHVKVIIVISVVSIILGVGVYAMTQNAVAALMLSLVADAIQVVTFVQWFFHREPNVEKMSKQVEVIYRYAREGREETKIADELVARLVREGVIKEKELSSMIRDKEIILAFSYAEGISSDRIRKITGGPPLKNMLKSLGFVPAASLQNLMVAMANTLPKPLRDIDGLNLFIRQELPKEWERISGEVKAQYPKDRYQIFERYRTGEGFKVSYILAKAMARDFIIDYMKKSSFTPEFQRHVAGRVDRAKLRKLLAGRRHRVMEVISKISIEFLLLGVQRQLRELIIGQESNLKSALGVKVITDYRLLKADNIASALHQRVPSADEALLRDCANNIIGESQKCYDALEKFGVHM